MDDDEDITTKELKIDINDSKRTTMIQQFLSPRTVASINFLKEIDVKKTIQVEKSRDNTSLNFLSKGADPTFSTRHNAGASTGKHL